MTNRSEKECYDLQIHDSYSLRLDRATFLPWEKFYSEHYWSLLYTFWGLCRGEFYRKAMFTQNRSNVCKHTCSMSQVSVIWFHQFLAMYEYDSLMRHESKFEWQFLYQLLYRSIFYSIYLMFSFATKRSFILAWFNGLMVSAWCTCVWW